MPSHPHTIDRVLSLALEPWALTRPMVAIVASILGRRLAGDAQDLAAMSPRALLPAASSAPGGVALIPVHGVLAPRANMLSDVSGATTFDQVGRAVDDAVHDPSISTIVLDIDSPGGSVLGASELSQKLRKARAVKRIVAHANFQACSAANWLAANATEIIAAPSSMLGSIGIFTIHEDLSKALDQAGVKLTFISAGKFKTDGNEAEPLSDSARARLQKQVDAAHNRFVGDVAAGRNVSAAKVRDGFGQGASVTADEALAAGMIDRIATFEEVLDRLLPASRGTSTLLAAIYDAKARMNQAALAQARRRWLTDPRNCFSHG